MSNEPTAPAPTPATPATTPAAPAVTPTTSETPEQKVQRESDERSAVLQANSGDLMSQFLMLLLKAIFGSLNDTTSEYSEIDPQNAAPADPQRESKARLAILNPEVQSKLRDLANKYTTLPANISPFTVNATITSGLGKRSIALAGASHDHQGIDIVPEDKSTLADITVHNTMPGVVVRSETQRDKNGNMAGFGNWVEVACIDGTRRRYGHLREQGVPVGTVLDQGDTVGIMGNTGTSEGAHLHYEWRDADGTTLEPTINDKTYARNDRSYIRSTVLASNVTPGAPAPTQLASTTPPPKAPAPAAPKHPAAPAPTPAVAQQLLGMQLPKFDVADAYQGAKTAFNNGMSAIGSVLRG